MDELDELESLDKVDDSGDIKNKILLSVLVVSIIIFNSICSCVSFKKVVIIYLKSLNFASENPWRVCLLEEIFSGKKHLFVGFL